MYGRAVVGQLISAVLTVTSASAYCTHKMLRTSTQMAFHAILAGNKIKCEKLIEQLIALFI